MYIYICICKYTYLTACSLYMHYHCYQLIIRVQHFSTNRERCEVLTGYLPLGAGLGVTGQIRDNGQNFYNLLFKQEVISVQITSTCSSLLHSLRRPLLRI